MNRREFIKTLAVVSAAPSLLKNASKPVVGDFNFHCADAELILSSRNPQFTRQLLDMEYLEKFD